MILTEKILEKCLDDFTLNQMQCKILNLSFPLKENWELEIIDRNVDDVVFELLVLLKGKISLKGQKQIVENYNLLNTLKNTKDENVSINEDYSSLEIYCDGAAVPNPGEAGSGIIIYRDDKVFKLLYGKYLEYGTNNIAELNALYDSLLIAEKEVNKNIKSIKIYSNSKYSIDCITNWAYNWKKSSWTKKDGEIKNLEIIKNAHELYDKINGNIEIIHVRGHVGIEGNEFADKMAMLAIKEKNSEYREYKER